MSLPQKPVPKTGSAIGTGPGTGPVLPHPSHQIRTIPAQAQIPRGPVQQPLEERLFTSVPTVYSPPPYPSGQNATPPTLVYSQSPQAMNTQQQTRSPFFQRPQIQASRTAIQNTNPSLRTGTPTPAPAVYPTNPPIMMVNPLSMQYTMPQSQYCIPPLSNSFGFYTFHRFSVKQ